MESILKQALAMNAKNYHYIWVNVIGVVFKTDSHYLGSYGATVYQLCNGKLVKIK
jgi:hypothetical protein